jgi:hypothetical protein
VKEKKQTIWKSLGKCPLGRPKILEDNIKMDIRKMGCEEGR